MHRHALTLGLAMKAAVLLSCGKEAPPKSNELDGLRQHFSAMAKADLADGTDNINEPAEFTKRTAILEDMRRKDPVAYKKFLLQLRAVLKGRKKMERDEDVEEELKFLDLEILSVRLEARNTHVDAKGTVHFQTPADEQKLGLGDLTPDDEITFTASEKTQKRMGITAKGPFSCVRTREPMNVQFGGKTIHVPKGTFVVRTSEGTHFKVAVFSGDTVTDSLTRELATDQSGDATTYEKIYKDEYEDLLTKDGSTFEQSHREFMEWSRTNKVPPTEHSIRAYLDGRRTQKKGSSGNGEQNNTASSGDGDKNRLSYHDQRATSPDDSIDIVRQKFGALFAIVRLHGQFFDAYTYNRLSQNYAAKLSSAVAEEKEYLLVSDITIGLNEETPNDIRRLAKKSSFAQRLNLSTSYSSSEDKELREALAFSESHFGGTQVSPDDFTVRYAGDGTLQTISFRGTSYEPQRFLAHPSKLRQIPNDEVTLDLGGGIVFPVHLQNYFDQYHALEAANANVPQSITVFDTASGSVKKYRNPAWFVERNAPRYREIAERITQGASTPVQKLLKLGRWLQTKIQYNDERTEINKLTLVTLTDKGGDCEDSATTMKTFAEAIGLGNEVGMVMFSDHVAPMLRGQHGGNPYNVDGEAWTIFELATEGATMEPGRTQHGKPIFYILPNGKYRAAASEVFPLNMVEEKSLDAALVANHTKAIGELLAFTKNPSNTASPENARRAQNIPAEVTAKVQVIKKAFGALAQTTLMAQTVWERHMKAMDGAREFLGGWQTFQRETRDRSRRIELSGAPEQFQTSITEYMRLLELIDARLQPTAEKVYAAVTKYQGQEDNYQAMVNLNNELSGIINDSEIFISAQRMQILYRDTLQHLPPPMNQQLKEAADETAKLTDELIAPYNEVRKILRSMSGR